MSPVYDCTTDEGRAEGIAQAAEAIRAGEVVVLPTDTVYGVGADAFSPEAVASVLAAKGRGREMPPPVLVPSVRTVDGLAADVPSWARDLIREFWPGPLTLIFKAQSSLMWDLGDTNGTVAIRMPQDDVALALLSEVGPLAVTSANLTGEPPATSVTAAAAQLGAAVTVYLDGGPARGSEVSTIVDCTGDEPVVLRHGAITEEQIDAVLAPPADPAGDLTTEATVEATTKATADATTEATVEATADATAGDQDEAIELPAKSPVESTLPGETHER